jgi:hypothetical protein
MKHIIAINLLLALFFAYLTASLHQEIESMKVAKNMDPVYAFTEFVRPPVALPEKWQDFFGATPAVAEAIANTVLPEDEDNSSKPFQGKIRLRGIFIYDNVQKAVITTAGGKGQEKPKEQQKMIICKTGDTVEGFTVTRIMPDRIVLTSQSSEPVTIMVYKPLFINGKND